MIWAHLEAVKRYDLDTVMFPIYPRVWADPVYRSDAEALLGYCRGHDIGVQVIKAIARKPWGETAPFHRSWYHPQTEAEGIARGVGFALSTPGVTGICTVGDLELLPLVLDAAQAVQPWTAQQREQAMLEVVTDAVPRLGRDEWCHRFEMRLTG